MKTAIAFAVTAIFASCAAFAQNDQPRQPKNAPIRVAQAAAGGAAAGAGEAAGVAGTGISVTGLIAIGAGVALVGAAAGGGSSSTTNH